MSECPSAMEIALYADGQMDAIDASFLREHVANCPSCADAILNLMQINDLSVDGHLPVVSMLEQEEAFQRIETHWNESTDDNLPIDSVRNDQAEASVLSDGIDYSRAKGDAADNEEDAMDKESDAEQMQNAIKSVFIPGMVVAPEVIGYSNIPGYGIPNILQSYSDTCAIRSQELILRDFGLQVTQNQLAWEAQHNGWYVPGMGTPDDALGKLIEAHGIPVQRYEQANIFNLVSELAQGHRVILSVDSGELWSTNDILRPVYELNQEVWEDNRPDHAVIVSGVDVSDAQNPVVIVTDPGTGEISARYALSDFLEAWEDSGFSMVATTVAPSQFQMDHVGYIGNLDYGQFSQWYPSVEHMSPDASGFVGLCSEFDRMVKDPDFQRQHSLLDILTSHIPEPFQEITDSIIPLLGLNSTDADSDDGQDDGDIDRV